ncbi:MAG TPA: L,D-transpeptidase [Actinomycetota bacterium]
MRRVAASIALVLFLADCTMTAVLPAPPASPALRRQRACARYTLIGQIRGRSVPALRRPARSARVVARFPRVNAQGATQVFPLLDETYARGDVWYKALLPIRPNDSTGWIVGDDLRFQRSDYRLRIDLSRLRLEVYRLCRRVATYAIGVGTKDTPTPRGSFFLNSLLRPPERGSVYGAFAFGLSGYSDVIRDWDGGGIVGIHGTNDPSSIGRRASHGCIRMRNADIRALVRILPLGTPVTIR